MGVLSGEHRDLDRTLDRKLAAIALDSLDLMQCLGCQVALTTMRTRDDWNVLYDEEMFRLTVCPCYTAQTGSLLSTVIAYHDLPLS
jgi:hypothetical protein